MRSARRLIVVTRADPNGHYNWIGPPRPDDLTIAMDSAAHHDLAARRPLLFDELESWAQRSEAEHRVAQLMATIREHPGIASIRWHGFSLIDFAEPRLRLEVGQLLRGWRLARAAGGARELICDTAAPAALAIGVRAGLGLDPMASTYTIAPALPGSRRKRALARPLMRALAGASGSERVRIAAVVAGKLALALSSLSGSELRELGVGAMPFPGLDHGNGALFALRHRRPLLATYGPLHTVGGRGPTASGPYVRIPERLDLDDAPALDRALAMLVGGLLLAAAPELAQAVTALAGLQRARSLRALVLPSAGYGASRLLIAWAHERGLQVGSMQHGIFSQQEVEDGERRVDVVFGWGESTVEQTLGWPAPRARIWPVGLPGMTPSQAGHRRAGLARVLIATTSASDALIAPAAFCETFIEVIAPGLRRLAEAGVELELRPHPTEDPARYRLLLDAHQLDVKVVAGGPFAAAAARADLVISSTSSVVFEAAGLGLPVLLWLGGAPQWVRDKYLVVPWTETLPGMFDRAEELTVLVDDLLLRPAQAAVTAHALAAYLRRFAEPFQPQRFADGLRLLLTTSRYPPAAVAL